MSDFVPLLKSKAGVQWSMREDAGLGATFLAQQDVAPILEANKALATHNDGFTPSRDMVRVATIPITIIHKWMTEEGWDPYSPDPGCQKRLARKLDSSEFRYLRTSSITVGDNYKNAGR